MYNEIKIKKYMNIKKILSILFKAIMSPSEYYTYICLIVSLCFLLITYFFVPLLNNIKSIVLLAFLYSFISVSIIVIRKINNHYKKKLKITLRISKEKYEKEINLCNWNVISFRNTPKFIPTSIIQEELHTITISLKKISNIHLKEINISFGNDDFIIKKYTGIINKEVNKIFNKQLEQSMASELDGFLHQHWTTSQYFNDFISEKIEYKDIHKKIKKNLFQHREIFSEGEKEKINLEYIEFLKKLYFSNRKFELENMNIDKNIIMKNDIDFNIEELGNEKKITFLSELLDKNETLIINIKINNRKMIYKIKIKELLKENDISFNV